MNEASALESLKSGDIPAFIAAVDWDESEWIEVPVIMGPNDGPLFNGRFGTIVTGVAPRGSGMYEVHLHTHESDAKATECYAANMTDIHGMLATATAMADSPAVGVVLMSDIPYPNGMYL